MTLRAPLLVAALALLWGSGFFWIKLEQCLKPVDVDVREGRTFPVIE